MYILYCKPKKNLGMLKLFKKVLYQALKLSSVQYGDFKDWQFPKYESYETIPGKHSMATDVSYLVFTLPQKLKIIPTMNVFMKHMQIKAWNLIFAALKVAQMTGTPKTLQNGYK